MNCSSLSILKLAGRKWFAPIFCSVKDMKKARFSDIESRCKRNLSPRGLSKILGEFVEAKIFMKTKEGRETFYELTDSGKRLFNLLRTVNSWCRMNELDMPENCELNCMDCRAF